MIFSHCPECISDSLEYDGVKKYYCSHCGFTYFHNPAAAVAGIIFLNEKLLLIKRARDPGKGKLDLPGGFVDPGESAEDALKRELYEELGIRVTTYSYFMSFPNTYEYKGMTYSTCDLFFTLIIETLPQHWEKDEIEDVILVPPGSIAHLDFAFSSIKNALVKYMTSPGISCR